VGTDPGQLPRDVRPGDEDDPIGRSVAVEVLAVGFRLALSHQRGRQHIAQGAEGELEESSGHGARGCEVASAFDVV